MEIDVQRKYRDGDIWRYISIRYINDMEVSGGTGGIWRYLKKCIDNLQQTMGTWMKY